MPAVPCSAFPCLRRLVVLHHSVREPWEHEALWRWIRLVFALPYRAAPLHTLIVRGHQDDKTGCGIRPFVIETLQNIRITLRCLGLDHTVFNSKTILKFLISFGAGLKELAFQAHVPVQDIWVGNSSSIEPFSSHRF